MTRDKKRSIDQFNRKVYLSALVFILIISGLLCLLTHSGLVSLSGNFNQNLFTGLSFGVPESSNPITPEKSVSPDSINSEITSQKDKEFQAQEFKIADSVSKCVAISSPGEYQLENHLSGADISTSGPFSTDKTCLKIESDDVVLDCHGFNITNDGTANTAGIIVPGNDTEDYTNVTIKNCPHISEYRSGVVLYKTSNDTIYNVTSHNNTQYGIYIEASSFNNISNNHIYSNSNNGIITYSGSSDNNIGRNNVHHNGGDAGIHSTTNCVRNTYRHNVVYNNNDGFRTIMSCSYATYINNTVHENNNQGIVSLSGSNYHNSTDNQVYNNGASGFYLSTSLRSHLENNEVYNNTNRGIDILNSDYVVMEKNIIYGNGLTSSTNYDLIISSTTSSAVISNTLIYTNKTNYPGIRYFRQVGTASPTNNHTNLTVCFNETTGCVSWGFLNLSEALLNASTYIGHPEFVSLNDSFNPELNTSANITISKNVSCSAIKYYRLSGFPKTKQEILSNKTSFTPSYFVCNDSLNQTTFQVSSFSGYTSDAETYTPKVLNISVIYPESNLVIPLGTFFKFIVNISCLSGDCGDINVSLDPPLGNYSLDLNNVTADVKYGSSGTGPNGGGQIKWAIPSDLHGRSILNASLCFHNRDSESDQFLKTIWLINESDNWDESSSASVLNNQQKILAINVSSSCGTPNCISCHNVTELMQRAVDLEYTNVTFRIEAAELHLSSIDSVTNNDGLEPGTYWVFDDREMSQSRGGPTLNITYGTIEKNLVSNITGSTPFYTNSSNPQIINLNSSQSQIMTFWMNATQTGTHEIFVIINRTSPQYEGAKSPSRNITILEDQIIVELISPFNNNHTIDLENAVLQCNASNYFGIVENISLYDSAQGWNLIETKYPRTQAAQVNFSRDYTPNNTFIDTRITWNCLGYTNRSKLGFAQSNFTFSNWDLGNYSDSISISNGQVTATAKGYLTNTQERHDLTLNVDPYMSSCHDPTTGRIFYAWAEENSSTNVDQLWTSYLEKDNTGWTEVKRTNSSRDRNYPSMDVHGNHVYVTYVGEDVTDYFQKQIWLGIMNLSGGEWNEIQLTNYSNDVNWPKMVIDRNNNQIYISFVKESDLWLGIYNISNGQFTDIELNDSFSFQDSPLTIDPNRNKLYFLASATQGGSFNVSYVSTNLDGSNFTQKRIYSSSGWALGGFNDIVYDPVSDNIYYSISRLVSGSNWDLLKGVCDYDGENCHTELLNSSASTLSTFGRIALLNSTIAMTWIYGTQLSTPYNLELYAAEFTRNDSFSIIGESFQKTNNNDETAYYTMVYDSLENKVRIFYQTTNSDVTQIYGLFTADWSLGEDAIYTSRIMNKTNPLSWINLTYVSNEPSGTEINFEFRTSDDLVSWTNWTSISNLSSNIRARYFQYRALMNNTLGPPQTPSISQVNINYGSEPYPEVTLNSPTNLNHTINMKNVTFNCSINAPDSELVNVSLYSNQNGNWELIETQPLSGNQGQGIFNYNLASPYDFRYRSILWNCLAYNNYSNYDWGNSDFIFDSWGRGTLNNTQVSSSGSVEISSITSESEHVDYWQDLTLSGNTPMNTALPALVWEPINQQLVLFGGQEIASGNYLDETWIFYYHNQTWENITASTVPPDFNNEIYGAGYDENLSLIVALADSSSAGQLVAWYYNHSNRTWSYQNTTNLPSPDTVRAKIYDEEENKFTLLANMSDGNNYLFFYDYINDLWSNISLGTNGPRTQQYMAAAADPEKDIYLFFGGSSTSSPPWTEYNNTWIYNKTSQTIYELTGLSTQPSSRTYNNEMVYDPDKKVSILFGGGWFDGVANIYSHNDTWYFNSSSMTWSRQNFIVKPPGIAAAGMEYIPHPDYSTVVIGGGLADYISGVPYQNDETWELKYFKNYSTTIDDFSQAVSVSNGTAIEDWTAYLSGSGTVRVEGNGGTNWPGVAMFNTSNESTDAACLVKSNVDSTYLFSQKVRFDSITGVNNPGLISLAVMSDNYYPIQNSSEVYDSYKLAIVGLELLGSPFLAFEYINNSQEALFWEFDNDLWSTDPAHSLPISYNSWYIHELRKNSTHYIFLLKNITTGFALEEAALPLSEVQDGYGHDNLVIGESIEDWETGILQVDDFTYKYEGEASGQGQFVSEEFDSGEPNEWQIIWNETIGNNSDIIFKGRSSDNGIVWSNWFNISSNPSGVVASNSRYFQFKSILNTSSSSPLLNEVGINHSSECVDNDNDGFGTGYTSKCSRPELDCNDNDASVIPPYFGMNISQDTTFCSGTYNLTGSGDAITINNSDVALVCNQTIIVNDNISNDIIGIYFNRQSNINISGCVIRNFKKANIKFENSQDIGIFNNNLTGGEYGLWGNSNTSNVFVYNNYLAHNNDSQSKGYGLVAQNGVYNWIIRKNYVTNNSHGGLVVYQTGSGNLIENNTCIANGAQGGIGDFAMNNSIIRNNIATGHYGDPNVSRVGMGIIVANNVGAFDYGDSYNAHVYNNTVYGNDAGISILGNNSLIEDNDIYNNTFGVYSQNTTAITWLRLWGHNNTVRNNDIYNNTYGIFINGSDYNRFINNRINNSTYGIYFLTADNSTIFNNQISNADYSIYFAEDDSSQSCNGFVLACGSFGSQLACNNQQGCFWLAFPLPGQCTGTATPCNQMSLSQCTQQQSCSLSTNYYNTMGGNISNNILSNGIEGMHLIGKWGKFLIGPKVIKGGYYTIKNNQFNNFNTGLYVGNTNHNNFTNNTFIDNQVGIRLNGSQLADKNYFQNTLIDDTEVSFDYLMYLDVSNGSMKGTAPEGYNPIGKFLEISNFSSHSSMFMNISFHYNESKLGDVNESTLKVWRYNGSHWAIASANSTVNTAQNYVNAYLANFSTFAPMGELPAASPGWKTINYPEGIYEPENNSLPGTHLSEFRIKFIELNSSSNSVLECMVQQTDGSVFSLNQTLATNNYKNNISLNYTIQPTDSVNNTKPWKIINCSLYNSTRSMVFTTNSNYNHPLNKSILVHNNTWTKFNSANADAFKAAQCFIGEKNQYFKNQITCDYIGDVNFAVSMATGFTIEGYCDDQIDNDGNSDIDCDDRYCQGIPYTCQFNGSQGFSVSKASMITGSATGSAAASAGFQTQAFGGTCTNGLCSETITFGSHSITYYYNEYIRPGETLKVRFDGGSYSSSSPIQYVIKDLTGYTNYGRYNNSYGLNQLTNTSTSVSAKDTDGHTGDIDLVLWANLSSVSYIDGNDYAFTIYMIHENADKLITQIPIKIRSAAPDAWIESDTGTGRTSPCSNSVDEDLDYTHGCGDLDCNNSIGGTHCNGSGAYCEYGLETTCSDCFDNDQSGAYDCADANCDLEPGNYQNLSVLCHYQGEGRNTYDLSIYPWTIGCADNFNNDQQDGIDCYDSTYCWGRGGTSVTLPCPAYENNTAQWCHDDFNNDYQGRTDCADYDCYHVHFENATYNATCPTNEAYDEHGNYAPLQCFDDLDNDLDSPTQQYSGIGDNIDCSDPDCLGVVHPTLNLTCLTQEYNLSLNISASYCSNTLDDDSDNYLGWPSGGTDCSDPDCHAQFGVCGPCPSMENISWDSCANYIDDDTDKPSGLTDCRDPDCLDEIGSTNSGQRCKNNENSAALCQDEFDNDADGAADCLDIECDTLGICEYNTELTCNDQEDNDADGYIDCSDSDCYGAASCASKSWTSTSCTQVPHNSGLNTVGATSVRVNQLDRHYVGTNYSITVTGTSSYYASVTITLGDATDTNKYFPYDASSCVLSGDTDKIKWVASQSEIGQLQDKGAAINGGFTVQLDCSSLATPQTNSYPVIVSNELSGGQTESDEESISAIVYENTAPSISEVEIAPWTGTAVEIDYNDNFKIRGISSNDASNICQCKFDVSGTIYTSNGDCLYTLPAQTDDTTYTISAAARDGVYNLGDYAGTISVPVDVKPIMNSISLNKAEPFYNASASESLSFTSSFSTASSGNIASCLVFVQNETDNTVHSQVTAAVGGSTASCDDTIDLSGLNDGIYYLVINAQDEDGDFAISDRKPFYVCSSTASEGSGWTCAKADFDQDGSADSYNCDFAPQYQVDLELNINLITFTSNIKSISIYESSTGSLVAENNTNASSVMFNLAAGTYDITLDVYGSEIVVNLNDISLTSDQNYTIYLDSINSTVYGLKTFTVETDFTISSADISLCYGNLSYTEEDKLEIHKCDTWDKDTHVCSSGWSEISHEHNHSEKTCTVNVNSLSGFAIVEPGETIAGSGQGGSSQNFIDVFIKPECIGRPIDVWVKSSQEKALSHANLYLFKGISTNAEDKIDTIYMYLKLPYKGGNALYANFTIDEPGTYTVLVEDRIFRHAQRTFDIEECPESIEIELAPLPEEIKESPIIEMPAVMEAISVKIEQKPLWKVPISLLSIIILGLIIFYIARKISRKK